MGFNDSISAAIQKDTPAVGLEDSLRTAVRKMSDAGASAIIVQSGAELVGIVTVMDLMNSVCRNDDLDGTKVTSFMTACELITRVVARVPCIQLDEDESVKNALDIMNEAGVHDLLVSGGPQGKAIGMVSAADLLKIAVQ